MYATRVTLCIERVALLGVGRCHAESGSFGRGVLVFGVAIVVSRVVRPCFASSAHILQ